MYRIGHRGACGYEPENTIQSFNKALDLGVDMIEFDAHVCKSGEVVIIHDDTVDRTTGGHGHVADMTFEQLSRLDAGRGERIPTLEQALEAIVGRAAVNVELKGEGTAKAVADVIRRYVAERHWKYEQFLVSSFDHYKVQEFKQLLPEVPAGALLAGVPIGMAEFATKAGAQAVCQWVEFVNEAFVDDVHQRGMKLYVWTVNDREDIGRMKSLGVDGIFSDFPDRI